MSKLFIHIYKWFEDHKLIFYTLLIGCIAAFALMASKISLQENISNFFNTSNGQKNAVFQNFKAKDKIVVMVSGKDPDEIINSAEIFENYLVENEADSLIASITSNADEDVINKCIAFIYNHLPIFLTDEDYRSLEDKISKENIDSSIQNVYHQLISPSGMIIGDVLMKDPLNIGTPLLRNFEKFKPDAEYQIYDGRLFSKDLKTLIMFIEPKNGMGNTGKNDELVNLLETAEKKAEINDVHIDCIGGPIVAVYNARQIKKDTNFTLTLALIILLTVIALSFKNKFAIPLIILPPAFGALFSLAMIWLIQGEISVIAIGAGTVVLGISLSYSIHMIAHSNRTTNPIVLIEELAEPLTIGCLTTIGAFAALMFTSSPLLQDMGLFSVFALIGTIVFCLIFLPHFIKHFNSNGKNSKFLDFIESGVSYKYESNKWLTIVICLATFIGLFFYQKVEFDDDMSHINYMPKHIVEAENRSLKILGDESKEVYIISGNKNLDTLSEEYNKLISVLDKFEKDHKIEKVVSVNDFVIAPKVQKERIAKWNAFWAKNKAQTFKEIENASKRLGFKGNAFAKFEDIVNTNYKVCDYSRSEMAEIPAISDWVNSSGNITTLMSRISIDKENKEEVYKAIDEFNGSAVMDRGYFSSKMVDSTNNDFNYILFISSLIVFIGLFLSYGRIELTLFTFLPMCISWVIILGMMAIFNIKFNIVNIILATFIFGIGDDFSIFIMDGLIQKYKNGTELLNAHKIAIFFSAFTAVIGMGVLIFAKHPALQSIAFISVLGVTIVVLISYTIQPILFKLLVTSQTKKGGFPYTLMSILNTLYAFLYFLIGCIICHIYIFILWLLPIKRVKKKESFHKLLHKFSKVFVKSIFTVKILNKNPYEENFDKPSMIIANHQSFIDILLILALTPKIVILTNSWVWNSPFFGKIVRYADFYHTSDGYEELAEKLKVRIEEGYSILVFPEGTRSNDCSIKRFHKGAFYLAQLLKLDILPILIYGAGNISTKEQGFYIKRGTISTRIMKRLKFGDNSFGVTYQEQAKNFRRYFIEEYRIENEELGRTSNQYFKDALIKNYIYKGPVLEWYMRIKCRIDGYYDFWDRLIPRNASITDVGCGYGQMSFMLGILSPERKILGIDYDSDKIDLANNSFLIKKGNFKFEKADMREAILPKSDVVLFNDSLHYVDADSQWKILEKAVSSLNNNGFIIVRDGDSSRSQAHKKIQWTEIWSTKIMKFNRTSDELDFVDSAWMKKFAEAHNLDIRIKRCSESDSETFYILSTRNDE